MLISDAFTCAAALRFVCRSQPRVAVCLEKHGREQINVTETTPRSSRSPSRRTCQFFDSSANELPPVVLISDAPSSEFQMVVCGMFVLAFIYVCSIVIAEFYVIK